MDQPTQADALLERVDLLCCAYPHAEPGALLEQVEALRRVLLDMHANAPMPGRRRDLIVAAGWATLLAACLRQDLGQRGAATALANAARSMGDAGDEQRIAAWSWEIQAWQQVVAGEHRTAQQTACAARAFAPTSSVAVQLAVQEAKAAAHCGDAPAVHAALGTAERLLADLPATSRPEHHFVFDQTKLRFYAVQSWGVLGNERRMAEAASEVYATCVAADGTTRWPMRIAQVQLELAHASARAGDLDAAAGYGLQALAHDRQSGPSLLPRAVDLDAVIYRRWPGESRGRAFRAQLRRLQHRFAQP
jgi:hypothetical protein